MQPTKRNEIIQAHLSAMLTQTDICGGICICVRPGAELVDVVGLCDQSDAAAIEMLSNLSATLQLLLRDKIIRADGTLNLPKTTIDVLADADDEADDEPTVLH